MRAGKSKLQTISGVERLVEALRVLPGVGPRSAQRMAYHLLQQDRQGAELLAASIAHALTHVQRCSSCNNFSETDTCGLCASPHRDRSLLCVVETPADLAMVEETMMYSGLYYVLMGRLSPLDGVGPRDLGLDRLQRRTLDGTVKELILATNFTNEGEATAHFIGESLRDQGIQVSRLARGVPLGGELEYVDAGTVSQALLERRPL